MPLQVGVKVATGAVRLLCVRVPLAVSPNNDHSCPCTLSLSPSYPSANALPTVHRSVLPSLLSVRQRSPDRPSFCLTPPSSLSPPRPAAVLFLLRNRLMRPMMKEQRSAGTIGKRRGKFRAAAEDLLKASANACAMSCDAGRPFSPAFDNSGIPTCAANT